MRISFNLKLEQTQKLIMTPELQQAINLLQFSSLELQDYVQEELLNNPVLEVEEGDDNEKKPELVAQSREHEKDAIDWDEYLQEQGFETLSRYNIINNSQTAPSFDYYLSKEPSLQEYLLLQLGLCTLTETERRIGEFIIGNIDHNGYLKDDIVELSLLLGVEVREIKAVLEVIQKFDPTGVGARNLQECLLIQLAEEKVVHPLAKRIIKEYLPDVAENKLKKISTELHSDLSLIQAAVDFVRTLDPKPGRMFGDNRDIRYIIPDVVVEKVSGDYVVQVNEQSIPRLTINPFYRSLMRKEGGEPLTSIFIKSRLDSALWLLRSIEQRRLTLYRVTDCVVRIQRDFFEGGIKLLKPLTLRQVAEEVGVHESTVSRATSNKYAQTPRGVYPLKFFFASGVEDDEGRAVSSASIKSHIRDLIEEENTHQPLSDQKLTELLKKMGIEISRRTVTKYREELMIPSSNRRKRH
jgi:RNA polymerase sigma-54 factor